MMPPPLRRVRPLLRSPSAADHVDKARRLIGGSDASRCRRDCRAYDVFVVAMSSGTSSTRAYADMPPTLHEDDRGTGGAERRHHRHHSGPVAAGLDADLVTGVGLGMRFDVSLRERVDVVGRGRSLYTAGGRAHGDGVQRRRRLTSLLCGLGDGAGGHDAAGQWRRRRGWRPRMGAARSAAIHSASGGIAPPPPMRARARGETRARPEAAHRGGAQRRRSLRAAILLDSGLGNWRSGRTSRGEGDARAAEGRAAPPYCSTRVEGFRGWCGRSRLRGARGRPRIRAARSAALICGLGSMCLGDGARGRVAAGPGRDRAAGGRAWGRRVAPPFNWRSAAARRVFTHVRRGHACPLFSLPCWRGIVDVDTGGATRWDGTRRWAPPSLRVSYGGSGGRLCRARVDSGTSFGSLPVRSRRVHKEDYLVAEGRAPAATARSAVAYHGTISFFDRSEAAVAAMQRAGAPDEEEDGAAEGRAHRDGARRRRKLQYPRSVSRWSRGDAGVVARGARTRRPLARAMGLGGHGGAPEG
ncbi:hypothetical protein BD626DRAFT_575821 [Schizophyllum amplum]|uniref:Uncharacterized protein n=1 Tax=Schizophyllum amplum TaxID=97359 RepID=A0A550BUT2_9AGAR|nr:hypothetical protein BD626DRAFT_575821 [Auriculariopsis ampla]